MKAKVETWLEQIRTGAIKSNLTRALKFIADAGIEGTSIYEMREALKMSHQSLTATVSMLADEGLLFEAGQFQVKNSWYTIYVYVSNENVRIDLAQNRKIEKYKQWVNRGIDEYEELMSPDTLKMLIEERGGSAL